MPEAVHEALIKEFGQTFSLFISEAWSLVSVGFGILKIYKGNGCFFSEMNYVTYDNGNIDDSVRPLQFSKN